MIYLKCIQIILGRILLPILNSVFFFQLSEEHKDCQRCLLNNLSNRTMSLDCNELVNSSRFISQRQYKRKLKRDCPSYATMDRAATKKVAKNEEEDVKMTMVSKTTFKLTSETKDCELMEIPLSPTHYQQPPTPDHPPPSALQAENAITKVLDALRTVILNKY